ncbi:MAG: hypothetical protein ABIM89_18710 [Mycobacteriales bacterium]
MKDAGSCFGYDVSSSIPLHFTRNAPSGQDTLLPTQTLNVVAYDNEPAGPDCELVITWTATPARPIAAQVYRAPGEGMYGVHIEGGGWFWVDTREPRITVPAGEEPTRREERLWGLPAMLCFAARGDLPLHAAAIDIGGRAVVLAGPSRAGKTTLAAAAVAAGWRLLSEDNTCIRLAGGPTVLPGPGLLRLRHDVAAKFDIPRSQTWDLGDDRLHMALHRDTRGDGRPVPLSAVVLLHATDDGDVTSRTVAPDQALRDLWSLSFRLPETRARIACFDRLAELVNRVPIHEVHRPLTMGSLPDLLELLKTLAHGE